MPSVPLKIPRTNILKSPPRLKRISRPMTFTPLVRSPSPLPPSKNPLPFPPPRPFSKLTKPTLSVLDRLDSQSVLLPPPDRKIKPSSCRTSEHPESSELRFSLEA